MNAIAGRPIPGRQILSRALAYRQMQASYEPRPRFIVPRSKGGALQLAWNRARYGASGADDVPVSELYNYGTKQTEASSGGSSAGALPAPNTSVYNSQTMTVIGNPGANLRASADGASQILVGELAGTTVTNVGTQQNGWMHVQDPNGVTGWIYSAYLVDAGGGTSSSSGSSSQVGSSTVASQSPSIMGGASGGGLLGLAVVGGAVIAAYYLLIK